MDNKTMKNADEPRASHTRRQLLQTTALAGCVLASATAISTGVVAQDEAGSEQWSFNTDGTITSSPTVVESFVYFANDEGKVYALNASSAFERWTFSTDDSVQSSPTVVSGIVFIGSQDNRLYAINAESGEEEWAFSTAGSVNSSPTVANETVFFGSDDGTLYAVDASSGREAWAYETGGAIRSSPVVVNETVFVGSSDGTLYGVNANSGEERWTFDTDGSIQRSPTVANETVYASSDDNILYAVSASGGEEQWTFESEFGGLSMPTVASTDPFVQDTVFVGDLTGTVYALNAEFGGTRWEKDLQDGTGTPTVTQSDVFFGNRNATYALNAENGSINWEINSEMTSTPVVADGTLFFGSGSALHAINSGTTSSSRGSRTRLGTLGHTSDWAYADQMIEIDTEPPPPDNNDDGSPPQQDDDDDSSPPPIGSDDNPPQPPQDNNLGMIVAWSAGATVLVGIGGIYKWLRSPGSDQQQPNDSDGERSSESPDVQDEIIEAANTRSQKSGDKPDGLRDDADGLVIDAASARKNGDLTTAISLYNKALDRYAAAADKINDEDTKDEIKEMITQTNSELETLSQTQNQRSDLIEALQLGEMSFQTAVAAHVRNEYTVAKIRYRQARDQYQRALDKIAERDHEGLREAAQVTVDREKNITPGAVSAVSNLSDEAVNALTESGIETVADLRAAQTTLTDDNRVKRIDTIERLRDEEIITDKAAAELTALHWWHDQEEYQFTTEVEIHRRYEQSSVGYEATK